MAVRIRLKRMGRKNRPFFRIVVADARGMRDGRVIERLGHYDPISPKTKNWELNVARAAYWLSVGAQPSETVASFLRKEGIWPREKAVEYLASAGEEQQAPAAQPAPAPKAEPAPAAEAEPAPAAEEEAKED